VTIQMKATEQCFPVVLFIMLYKVVLNFESVDEILKCDHSNESYWAVLSCGAVYYVVQVGSFFSVSGGNPKMWRVKWKLLSSTYSNQHAFFFFSSLDEVAVWPFKWKLLSSTFVCWWNMFVLNIKSSGEILSGAGCFSIFIDWTCESEGVQWFYN